MVMAHLQLSPYTIQPFIMYTEYAAGGSINIILFICWASIFTYSGLAASMGTYITVHKHT